MEEINNSREKLFLDDLKVVKSILLTAFNGEEKSLTKLERLLPQLVLNSNKDYPGAKLEYRLKEVVSEVVNVINENNLKYNVIDSLNLGKIKKEFFNELSNQLDSSKLSQLKFFEKPDEEQKARNKYLDNLVLRIKDSIKNNDTLKFPLIKSEIERLNLKYINGLSTKLLSDNILENQNIIKVIGKPILDSINQIKTIAELAQLDLKGIDISEQASILNKAKTPGLISESDASFAARVLITQQKALKAMAKINKNDVERE